MSMKHYKKDFNNPESTPVQPRRRRGTGYTEEELIQIASKYSTWNEFYKNENTAYQYVNKLGLKETVCEKAGLILQRNRSVTRGEGYEFDQILDVVQKHKSWKSFRDAENSMYQYALKQNWHIDIQKMAGFKVRAQRDANKYDYDQLKTLIKKTGKKNLSDLLADHYDLMGYAYSKNWMTQLRDDLGLISKTQPITEERIREAVAKCSSLNEFSTNYSGEYKKARELGIFEEITQPFRTLRVVDVVYLWNIKGSDIWKVGVSNQTEQDRRINAVSSQFYQGAGETYTIVSDRAAFIEGDMKSIGTPVKADDVIHLTDVDFEDLDGFSEMRVMTQDEVEAALSVLRDAQEEAIADLRKQFNQKLATMRSAEAALPKPKEQDPLQVAKTEAIKLVARYKLLKETGSEEELFQVKKALHTVSKTINALNEERGIVPISENLTIKSRSGFSL